MVPIVKDMSAKKGKLVMWFANTNSWATCEHLLEDMANLSSRPAVVGFAEHRLADSLRRDTAVRWLGKGGYKSQLEAAATTDKEGPLATSAGVGLAFADNFPHKFYNTPAGPLSGRVQSGWLKRGPTGGIAIFVVYFHVSAFILRYSKPQSYICILAWHPN